MASFEADAQVSEKTLLGRPKADHEHCTSSRL